ncbi:MAG: hypothetical protein LC808_02515, partial [Actinobacteria bacterium]|nr:hypothetical protein [Actinomycetota bacterium]
VVGDAPGRFLWTSRATAAWALDRFQPSQALFLERFGSLDMSIAAFTNGPAARVRITNLEKLLPEIREVNENV